MSFEKCDCARLHGSRRNRSPAPERPNSNCVGKAQSIAVQVECTKRSHFDIRVSGNPKAKTECVWVEDENSLSTCPFDGGLVKSESIRGNHQERKDCSHSLPFLVPGDMRIAHAAERNC